MTDHALRENLRLLCSLEPSVSALCRRLGMNRQQFGKYLNGQSRPSPYNLQRIAAHFGLEARDLATEPESFARAIRKNAVLPARARAKLPLERAFGDCKGMRRFCGYYHIHCHSHSWPGHLVRGIARVWEDGGVVRTRSLERFRAPSDGTVYRTNYLGQAVLLGSHIFIVEHQEVGNDAVAETVLEASPRSSVNLLAGLTLGFASRERQPYVSRSVWRYLGPSTDLRSALQRLGLFKPGDARLDPRVVSLLGSPVGPG